MSESAPAIPSSDDRIMAALSYAGGLFLGPVIPIFVFLLRGKESPFVRFHSAQAIAFELAVFVFAFVLGGCWVVGFIMAVLVNARGSGTFEPFIFLIWPAFVVLSFASVIVRIIAAMLVFQGRDIRIPLLGNWVDCALGPSAPPSLG